MFMELLHCPLVQCLLFVRVLYRSIHVLAAGLILRPLARLLSVRKSERLILHLSQHAKATFNELLGF